jgi:hypothetical protein
MYDSTMGEALFGIFTIDGMHTTQRKRVQLLRLELRGVFRHSREMKHISLLPTAEDTSVLWMTCC